MKPCEEGIKRVTIEIPTEAWTVLKADCLKKRIPLTKEIARILNAHIDHLEVKE